MYISSQREDSAAAAALQYLILLDDAAAQRRPPQKTQAQRREPAPILRGAHQNRRRFERRISRFAQLDEPCILLIDQHEVEKLAITSRDLERRYVELELLHDFRRGSLDRGTADEGRHREDGHLCAHEELAQPRHAKNGLDAQIGIGWAENDAFEMLIFECAANLGRERTASLGAVAKAASQRPASMLHEVLLEGHFALLGQHDRRRRLVAHGQK